MKVVRFTIQGLLRNVEEANRQSGGGENSSPDNHLLWFAAMF
jgi:hypothetical protein